MEHLAFIRNLKYFLNNLNNLAIHLGKYLEILLTFLNRCKLDRTHSSGFLIRLPRHLPFHQWYHYAGRLQSEIKNWWP